MYCRECGQKLTLRFCENEGLIPYCDKCENYIFPQFSIAVSMVVTNRAQDKILLAKHVEDEDFILFAGYIKKGENAEKTIPREIKEELGLEVVKAKYMSSRYHAKKGRIDAQLRRYRRRRGDKTQGRRSRRSALVYPGRSVAAHP